MKPRNNRFLSNSALAAITLAASATSAFAANGWWNTTDGNWDDVNNWWTSTAGTTIVGSVPTTGQTIQFNGTGVNGNQTVYLNGDRAGSTLTFSNTGSTTLLGGIDDTLTLSGGITVSAGAGRVNLGVNTTATTLTLSNTDVTTLSGANSFSGAITLGNGSTLKLANANAVAGTTTGFTGPNSSISTLWLADDTSTGINNLKINSANNVSITTRTIVDRATAGAAVDQSIAFVSTRGNYVFQKGNMVTSDTPLITASGTTTFGSGTNLNAASIFNPLGVNLSLGNMAAASTGAGSGSTNNGLVLDGNSTGNKVTGVISNGGSSLAALNPTITATSGSQTVTVSSNSFIVPGALLTGYAGIPDGTMVLGVSGTTLTLSQVTTADMTADAGSISSRVNETRLIKAGPSTWSLSGANTFSGITTVQGGTLNLDFSATGAPTSNILYNQYTGVAVRPTVTVAGGNLQLTGKAGTANTQNLNLLAALAGGYSSKVTVNGGAEGGTALLQISGLTLNTSGGSMIDFNTGAGGTINNSGATASRFVGWSATVNGGKDFAFYDENKNIVAAATGGDGNATGYAALEKDTTGSETRFYDLTGGLTRSLDVNLDPINFTYNGLKIASSGSDQVLDLNGGVFIDRNSNRSTILYAGGGNNKYTIQGGTLRPNATSGELTISAAAGTTLTVSSAISNNAAVVQTLTKSGAGTVVLSGTKDYTGKTYAIEGTLSIDTLAAGGTASGLGASTNANTNLIINGATVKYTGSQTTPATDRSFTIGSNGATLDASGDNALTWAPAAALAYAANQNTYLTLTGTNTGNNTFGGGTGVLANGAAGFTTLTKTGAGKWVLAGANTYTGGTYVNEGTLGVTGTETPGTSGPLGSVGPIVFGGGTLQYSATNTADYSKRILLSTSAIKIDTNGQAVTFASTLDSSNVGGLTLNDTAVTKGTLTLSGLNSYSGQTSVTAGTLAINGDNSAATGNVLVSGTGIKLKGTGTIGGDVTIQTGAIHAPGNSIGKQTIDEAGVATANLTYEQGSIFEWELGATLKDSTDGTRGTDYDSVNVSGALGTTGTGAIFRVVLGDAGDFAATFWDSDHIWTDIFKTSDSGSAVSFASVFNAGAIEYWNSGGNIGNTNGSRSFSISGSTLSWSAIPEPTSALAGLLIAAGLLRRRREEKF